MTGVMGGRATVRADVAIRSANAKMVVVQPMAMAGAELAERRARNPQKRTLIRMNERRGSTKDAVGTKGVHCVPNYLNVDSIHRLLHRLGTNDPVPQERLDRGNALRQSLLQSAATRWWRRDDEAVRWVASVEGANEILGGEELEVLGNRENLRLRMKMVG